MAENQNSDTTAPSGRELYHLQFSRWPVRKLSDTPSYIRVRPLTHTHTHTHSIFQLKQLSRSLNN